MIRNVLTHARGRSLHGTVERTEGDTFVVKVPQPMELLGADGKWHTDPERVYAFKWVKCQTEEKVSVGDEVIARTHPVRRSMKDPNGKELGGFVQHVDQLTIV